MHKFFRDNDVEVLDVWIAWSNSDLTEGRGYPIPLHTCEQRSTALKLGRGRNVQGSDCDVRPGQAFRVDGANFVLGRIELPTKDEIMAEKRAFSKKKILKKLKNLGITDEEIAQLSTGTIKS